MSKCFVIGPVGEVGSDIRTAADDFMKYIVAPVVTSDEFGYELVRADNLNEPGRITSQIIELLMDAELVVADLTTNNANVGPRSEVIRRQLSYTAVDWYRN